MIEDGNVAVGLKSMGASSGKGCASWEERASREPVEVEVWGEESTSERSPFAADALQGVPYQYARGL